MLNNYLKSSLNNFLNNKLFSFINIIGLSIGLTASILITLYVQQESSYDRHWDNSEKIYRVNFAANMPGNGLVRFTETPILAMPALVNYFPEAIAASSRIIWSNGLIRKGTDEFKEVLSKVDPQFTDVFNLETITESLVQTLDEPGNIALTQEVAIRFFGVADPIGEVLTIDEEGIPTEYKVTAVYQQPTQTILNLPMLARLNEQAVSAEWFTWISLTSDSYFRLKPDISIDSLHSQISQFIDQVVDVSAFFPDPNLVTSDIVQYSFQNIEEIYLNSPWDSQRQLGNKSQVLAFSAIAVLVLLIACLNFTILATAKMSQRAKEVALRKVMGAEIIEIVSLLLWQFTVPVLLANAIAWPIAFWAMLNWLQGFPYQINTVLLIPFCVLAGFIALLIAWLTVASNTLRVATTNPVHALRYE